MSPLAELVLPYSGEHTFACLCLEVWGGCFLFCFVLFFKLKQTNKYPQRAVYIHMFYASEFFLLFWIFSSDSVL